MITREPLTVAAGDTVTWSRTLADYPASTGWVLKYALRGPAVVDITGSSDGDTHIITIAPADLTTAGTYAVQGYVENGSERRTVYTGRLKVTPDLTAADATFDPRSHAQKVVEAIEAVIEGRATRDQQEMWIDGERIVRTHFDELLKIRQRYRHEIAAAEARERRSQGRSSGRTIKFRL
jgi:hypothetical protein